MRLSARQRDALEWAARCQDKGHDGYAARGASIGTAESLVRRGLLVFVDYGQCEDYPEDREFPIYATTEAGRRLLEQERT